MPGREFPLTIPAGQEVLVNVTFKPQSSGGKSAKLSFASNATNSPASEALAGTGTSNAAPYVSLSWKASTSRVAGYNVYRSTSLNGSYTRLNSSLGAGTSYMDATIASGATYYYATTAVNSAGEESGYSNRVQVVVP
jgi:fibronectin type 3 domain-containing protein